MPVKHCLRCGYVDEQSPCPQCGTYKSRKKWQLTPALIKRIHVIAMRQKGLSREEYELRLNAVGVNSCKELNQQRYERFMGALNRLPDAPLSHGS